MIAAYLSFLEQEAKKKQQENQSSPDIIARNVLTPGLIPIRSWLLPRGHAGRPGQKMNKIIGVTIHDTGNHDPKADAVYNCRYVHRYCVSKKLSFHLCIDEKEAIMLVPLDEVSFHGSNKTANSQTIGIEICVPKGGNWAKSHDNAVIMTAWILRNILKIPVGTDISKYLFTHLYWIKKSGLKTGKICPRQMLENQIPYSWDTFVSKVNKFFIG